MRDFEVLRGCVVLKGTGFKKKPQIYSIGGFMVELPDGREVHFDWNESSTGCDLRENGECFFESNLRDFDDELFQSSNETVTIDELTPELLISGKLTEVFYECYNELDNGDEESFELKLDSFELIFYAADSDEPSSYEFPESAIEEYNKMIAESENESKPEKMYVINLSSRYVRDIQTIHAPDRALVDDDSMDTFMEEVDEQCDICENGEWFGWFDTEPEPLFLGFAQGVDEEDAKRNFGRYASVMLDAVEVPSLKK